MDKESLKKRIVRYLKSSYGYDPNLYVGSFDIEKLAQSAGFMGSTSTRILRQLSEEGVLETKLFRGKSRARVAYYRWIDNKELQPVIDYWYNKFNEKRI